MKPYLKSDLTGEQEPCSKVNLTERNTQFSTNHIFTFTAQHTSDISQLSLSNHAQRNYF